MVFTDQVVVWQNYLSQIERVSELSADGLERLNRGLQFIYRRGFAKRFWETQREANVEKQAVRYIESVLARTSQPFA
jgi:hypothetical protein